MQKLIIPFLGLSIIILLLSCREKDAFTSEELPGDETLVASDPLLKLLPASHTGIDFKNYIRETFELNITTHINTSNGGGVAILDANNDGLQDIYLISSSAENKLYINQGGLKFVDKTAGSGLESPEGFEVAVTVVDINADGWQDVYVCRGGPVVNDMRRNKLYVNNGDLTFSDKSKEYGLDDMSACMGAVFFDYDNDGDLDAYILNYPVDFGWASKISVRPTADGKGVEPNLVPIEEFDSDRFYRNDGPPMPDGTGGFKDVSKETGIWNFAFGLSVAIEDFNNDGWMDVYVGNDFIQPDMIYINNRDGTFTDKIGDYLKHSAQHTMGIDLSDFDNDGLFDIYSVDMLSETQYRRKTVLSTNPQNKYNNLIKHGYFEPVTRNVLQRNNGNGTFSDIACLANVYRTDWSWSCLMSDLDNDSWKDLLVTNGYQREVTDMDFINFKFIQIEDKGSLHTQFNDVFDFLKLIPQYKLRDFVFRNKGDLTFEDKSGDWMTMKATWSNGAATADLDNDGDMDYIVNNIEDEAFVYENTAVQNNTGHFLQLACKGSGGNPFGIGTKVFIYHDGMVQYNMQTPSKGIFSSVEHLIHFGLGKSIQADSILIIWPDGKSEIKKNIKADQRIVLDHQNASSVKKWSPNISSTPIFNEAPKAVKFRHVENDFIDYETYFLMPWALSELGPLVSTADVNGDQLTDFYIGNSFGQPKGLYAQQADGTFRMISKDTWAPDSIYEDHGSIFFDADLDGDMDLFVISGGYESISPLAWQSRLYINEGGNTFIHAKGAIPLLEDVCLRGVAHDYDKDGDIDIILGGRVMPGKYPQTPKSYILRNDRNRFVDATNEVAPDFRECGMVTDLQFADLDKDGTDELVVVGEWMPVTIFKLTGGKLSKMDGNAMELGNSNGFWNRLQIADMDGDGDLDLITGNLGLNSHYQPTAEYPVNCYMGDYDQNGSIDPIITYFEKGIEYPIVQKDVLIKQIPPLKKKFIYYKDYAEASIQEVLTEKQIKESVILQSKMAASGWWENKNNKFVFHPFPNPMQASPIYGIIVHDFNGDGITDILTAGNKYSMEVETGRLDAGTGSYLEGLGNGKFSYKKNLESGFWAQKEVRDLGLLTRPDGKMKVIVTNNDDFIQLYDVAR